MPENTFYGSKSVSVILPDGLARIDAGYLPKRNLGEVRVPASVVEISDNAFAGYDTLENVVFAEGIGLQRIGNCAFYGTGIKEFIAPAQLAEIGYMAFMNCRYLYRAKFGDSVEKAGRLCFWGTQIGLWDVRTLVNRLQDKLGINYRYAHTTVLPEGLEIVREGAFQNCAM